MTHGVTNVTELINSREFLAVIHDFYFGNILQLLRIPGLYDKKGLKRDLEK